MFDLNALRLTDDEIGIALEADGNEDESILSASAQFAKLTWGIREWLIDMDTVADLRKGESVLTLNRLADTLLKALKQANIKRPTRTEVV